MLWSVRNMFLQRTFCAQDPSPQGFVKSTKGRDAPIWEASRLKEWLGCQQRNPPAFGEGYSIADVRAAGHHLHRLNWIFKVKPEKDKSRIVLDGTQQDPSTHDDIYSPTAHITAFHLLMVRAADRNGGFIQMMHRRHFSTH
jgi:hypothetical protein